MHRPENTVLRRIENRGGCDGFGIDFLAGGFPDDIRSELYYHLPIIALLT